MASLFENLAPQDRPIHIGWVKHIRNDEEKIKFKQALQGSAFVLRILKKLIEEEKEVLRRSESTLDDFTGDWAFKQAFRNGERRGLKFVEDLLDFTG